MCTSLIGVPSIRYVVTDTHSLTALLNHHYYTNKLAQSDREIYINHMGVNITIYLRTRNLVAVRLYSRESNFFDFVCLMYKFPILHARFDS